MNPSPPLREDRLQGKAVEKSVLEGISGMTTAKFGQQIDHLLWTGMLEGKDLLRLYHLLQAYKQGLISDKAMQQAINQHDPDYVEQWLEDNLPPLFE